MAHARGYCSACPDVDFVFAVNTDENLRLMQQAFAIHFQDVHVLSREMNAEKSVEAEDAA